MGAASTTLASERDIFIFRNGPVHNDPNDDVVQSGQDAIRDAILNYDFPVSETYQDDGFNILYLQNQDAADVANIKLNTTKDVIRDAIEDSYGVGTRIWTTPITVSSTGMPTTADLDLIWGHITAHNSAGNIRIIVITGAAFEALSDEANIYFKSDDWDVVNATLNAANSMFLRHHPCTPNINRDYLFNKFFRVHFTGEGATSSVDHVGFNHIESIPITCSNPTYEETTEGYRLFCDGVPVTCQ